ncbi:MAG TPA: nucleotide exchange factor GrpE [Actinomycetota bacterium]|nr:nucleotide exchange factor GrpE [Actinomycetota bacterium]
MENGPARERKVKVHDKRRAAVSHAPRAAGPDAAVAPETAEPDAAAGARAEPAPEASAAGSPEPGAATPENVGVPGGEPAGAHGDEPAGARAASDAAASAPAEAEPSGAPDYLDDLRRLQAEFDNYRKRMMREQAQITERATAGLVERLLPVLDDFERALGHGDVSEGVRLVHRQLVDVLASAGLAEIEAEGRPFDPTVHEAVDSREDAAVDEVTCVTVYRRGYRFGDRVVRPAMVAVARPVEEASARDDAPLEADGGS